MEHSRLKILQLRSHAGFYGVEKVVIELAAGLSARGHDITIGIIQGMQLDDQDFQTMAAKKGLAYVVFPSARPFDRQTIIRIRNFIEAERPQVIHSHGYKADVFAWVANRAFGLPLISTCHPWLDTERDYRAAFYALVDKVTLLRFDRIVAVSEEVRQRCRVGLFRKSSIPVIANGVAVEPPAPAGWRAELRLQLGIPSTSLIVGCVARLTPEKGHCHLLRAFASLKGKSSRPMALLLLGDGEESKDLKDLCRQLEIADQVFFLGHREDVPALLAEMDLFVLPSLSEGLPMALLEAMAAGVPVVATAVGGVPEALDQGRAGLLVPSADPGALATAMARLAENADERHALARSGRHRIAAAYSREIMTEKYEKEYRDLVLRKGGS